MQLKVIFGGVALFMGRKRRVFIAWIKKAITIVLVAGASGSHFNFLMELDGLSFPEAVERCADMAGMQMPVMDKREQEREEKRSTLFDVMEMASGYFRDQLQTADGAKARAYLRDRGLSIDVQQFFGLGFAPNNRNALKEYLAAKGVGKDQMEACGLVVFGDGIAVSYDRFVIALCIQFLTRVGG